MAVQPTRRRLLAAVSSGGVLGLSGCLGTLVPDVDETGDALVAELWIYDRESDESEPVADTHHGHWHGSLPDVPRRSVVSLGAAFRDHNRETIPIGADERYQLRVRGVDGGFETIAVDSRGDHVQIVGEEIGETELVFQLAENRDTVWEAPPISIDVTRV